VLDEMSFAFRVTRQEWSPDWMQRDILEYNINRGDVSVVTYGANPATSVALRSEDLTAMHRPPEGDALRDAAASPLASAPRPPDPAAPVVAVRRRGTLLTMPPVA
jgi:phage head maturation protease